MFIDTSAFVALLANEPDAPRLAKALGKAERRYTSGLVRLETVLRLSSKQRVRVEDAETAFDKLLLEAEISAEPITDSIARKAVAAFSRYGKGRGHKAQLNLADCMSYAVAAEYRSPILFIGKDFTHTDLTSALRNPQPPKTG